VTVLLDTAIIVDHLRGDGCALHLLHELLETEDRVWAATPTRTEVLADLRDAAYRGSTSTPTLRTQPANWLGSTGARTAVSVSTTT
jgi:hypothetical protein